MPITQLWFAKSLKGRKLDNTGKIHHNWGLAFLLLATQLVASNAIAQSPPPTLGEETKGTPAFEETAPLPKADAADTVNAQDAQQSDEQADAEPLLGTAKITELRRENGQIYEIELDHSLGAKQYIQENDSDGNIESTSNDLEETPNLPKWKLGSW